MDVSKHDYLRSVLQRLEHHYNLMAGAVGQPVAQRLTTNKVEGFWFRYPHQSDTLLCFLKGVKLISTLNGALVLLNAGCVQECSALFRVAIDCYTDIMFWLLPGDGDKPSQNQDRFFDEFFQEEFEDPAYPLGSQQKRDSVPRKTIMASVAKLTKDTLNPSDGHSTFLTLHRAFSGYLHGAYPHIMELYGGEPPRFHMSGMPNTVRETEGLAQFTTELYRAIMVSELVARKLGLDDRRQAIRVLLVEYETTLGVKSREKPEVLVRGAKKRS